MDFIKFVVKALITGIGMSIGLVGICLVAALVTNTGPTGEPLCESKDQARLCAFANIEE